MPAPRLSRWPPLTSRAGLGTKASLCRHASTLPALGDVEVARLAQQPIQPLALADLIKHGRPPLSTPALLASAQTTARLIPVRLAHRVQALRSLPFIVVSNPNIARIHQNYQTSLATLAPWFEHTFADLDAETRFSDALADLVQLHAHTIPLLARGFLESRRYIAPAAVTRFLDEHLRARIGTRLIAEQHLALHLSAQPHASTADATRTPSSYIGIIDTALRPASIVSLCADFVAELCELRYGVRPSVTITGDVDVTLAQLPTHLEYILTELLKNAFRATVENGRERDPIEITIASMRPNSSLSRSPAETTVESNQFSGIPSSRSSLIGDGTSMPDDETLTIRIRDRGGGIDAELLEKVWAYSFTTFSDAQAADRGAVSPTGIARNCTLDMSGAMDGLDAIAASGGNDRSTIAGLGYGLPLSRAFAEYFGGSIQLQSLWGWGTDVYLRLKGLRL